MRRTAFVRQARPDAGCIFSSRPSPIVPGNVDRSPPQLCYNGIRKFRSCPKRRWVRCVGEPSRNAAGKMRSGCMRERRPRCSSCLRSRSGSGLPNQKPDGIRYPPDAVRFAFLSPDSPDGLDDDPADHRGADERRKQQNGRHRCAEIHLALQQLSAHRRPQHRASRPVFPHCLQPMRRPRRSQKRGRDQQHRMTVFHNFHAVTPPCRGSILS